MSSDTENAGTELTNAEKAVTTGFAVQIVWTAEEVRDGLDDMLEFRRKAHDKMTETLNGLVDEMYTIQEELEDE